MNTATEHRIRTVPVPGYSAMFGPREHFYCSCGADHGVHGRRSPSLIAVREAHFAEIAK